MLFTNADEPTTYFLCVFIVIVLYDTIVKSFGSRPIQIIWKTTQSVATQPINCINLHIMSSTLDKQV